MPLTTLLQNSKLTKHAIPRALTIVEHYLASLSFCYERIKFDYTIMKYFQVNSESMGRSHEFSLETFMMITKLCAISQKAFRQNAFDLYEFFYLKREAELGEYFYYQFPLDIKRFEKERIPKKKIETLLKNLKGSEEEYLEKIEHNRKLFYECLATQSEK